MEIEALKAELKNKIDAAVIRDTANNEYENYKAKNKLYTYDEEALVKFVTAINKEIEKGYSLDDLNIFARSAYNNYYEIRFDNKISGEWQTEKIVLMKYPSELQKEHAANLKAIDDNQKRIKAEKEDAERKEREERNRNEKLEKMENEIKTLKEQLSEYQKKEENERMEKHGFKMISWNGSTYKEIEDGNVIYDAENDNEEQLESAKLVDEDAAIEVWRNRETEEDITVFSLTHGYYVSE